MKSLQESLLDDEDILMDNTDLTKDFPGPKDLFTKTIYSVRNAHPRARIRGGNIKDITGYYWHNPALFKKAGDRYTGIYVYLYKNWQGYVIGVNLEIDNNKLEEIRNRGELAIRNKENYGKIETKKLLYKFLTYLKDNPSFVSNLDKYRLKTVYIEDIIK